VLLVAGLQRLDAGDQHLVGQDAAGRQHLGAAHRDARRVAIDHAGGQERVGLLAGALTSTPTLAAAQSAVSSGLVPLPPGLSPQAANASIASSYAITYLVGTLGIIAVVSVLPRILGLDLAGDARRHAATNKQQAPEPLQARAYRVTNEAYCARPIAELALQIWDHFSAVWIRRNGVWIKPAADEQLRLGDEIHAYGNAQFFRAGIEQAGPEIRFLKETETAVTWTRVSVAKSAAIGRPLQELKLAGQVMPNVRKIVYNVDIKRVMRLKLWLGIADGWLSADGEIIYRAKDLRVGLLKQGAALQPGV